MSERITWHTCPHCGGRLAVGWARPSSTDQPQGTDSPVEADCSNGCRLSRAELQYLTDDD